MLDIRIFSNLIYRYRYGIYLAVAVVVCLVVITPTYASEVLETTAKRMIEGELWWDELWEDTFDPPGTAGSNISAYSFAGPVRFLLAIGMIFWMVDYGKKMSESKGMAQSFQIFFDSSLKIFLIIIFLTDQGSYSRFLAYGLRDITYSWSERAMNLQLADVKFRDAIKEQLLVEEVKNEISRQGEKCMQLPRPEVALPAAKRPPKDPNNPLTIEQDQAYRFLECLDKLVKYIDKKQAEAEAAKECRFGCKFFKLWIKSHVGILKFAILQEIVKRVPGYEGPKDFDQILEDKYHSAVDFFGNVEQKGWMAVFGLTQWMWITFLEGSMWLSGLFAPLFIAISFIPGKEKMFGIWLIEILTIGLARFAYIALLGVVAVQVSTTPQDVVLLSQDGRFFMALGVFAPGISMAVVVSGAIAAASSYRSQAVGAASTVAGIATGSIATLAYSLSRYADKKR